MEGQNRPACNCSSTSAAEPRRSSITRAVHRHIARRTWPTLETSSRRSASNRKHVTMVGGDRAASTMPRSYGLRCGAPTSAPSCTTSSKGHPAAGLVRRGELRGIGRVAERQDEVAAHRRPAGPGAPTRSACCGTWPARCRCPAPRHEHHVLSGATQVPWQRRAWAVGRDQGDRHGRAGQVIGVAADPRQLPQVLAVADHDECPLLLVLGAGGAPRRVQDPVQVLRRQRPVGELAHHPNRELTACQAPVTRPSTSIRIRLLMRPFDS